MDDVRHSIRAALDDPTLSDSLRALLLRADAGLLAGENAESPNGTAPPWEQPLWRALVDTLPFGMLVLRQPAHIIAYNQAALALLDLPASQLEDPTFLATAWPIFSLEGRTLSPQEYPAAQALEGGQVVRNIPLGFDPPNGRDRIWLNVSVEPFVVPGDPTPYVISTFQNITAQINAEQSLRLNHERYRRVSAITSDYAFAYRLQPDGTPHEVWNTETFSYLTGITDPARLSNPRLDYELYAPEDRDRVRTDVERTIEGNITSGEYRLLKASGEILWVSITRVPELDETAQNVIGYYGAVQNIHERKHAEEQLRQSEARYRTLLTQAERQARDLRLLDRLRIALAQQTELDHMIRNVVEDTAETFGYPLVSLYLLDDDRLILQHHVGYQHVISDLHISRGVMGRVVRTGAPTLVHNVSHDPDFIHVFDDTMSELCVPLPDQQQVIGVFNIETRGQQTLSEDDLAIMTVLAQYIGLAISRARLYTEVREKEARNRALLDSIPDMMVRFSADGTFLEIKPSSTFPPLIPPGNVVGRNIRDVLPLEIAVQCLVSQRTAVETGQIQIFEYQLPNGDELSDFEARIVPYKGGEVIALIRDIGDRKHAAQHLIEQQRLQVLKTFVDDISHDFRTPISTLVTSSYLMRKMTEKLLREHVKLSAPLALADTVARTAALDAIAETSIKINERAETMEDVTNRLNRLVEAMGQMARLDRETAYNLRLTDLNTSVRYVVDSLMPIATQKPLTLAFESAVRIAPVYIDETAFSRVIQNLVGNAIEYTPVGGSVTAIVRSDGDRIVMEVRDTGIGISADDLTRIFDRFFRADKARSANAGGTGLGLAIAKKITEAHGAAIEVESEIGYGSCFRVIFPPN